MFFHQLTIAIRSLLKFKGYTSINLIGLALGLTAGIFILLYVLDETSFDKFHAKRDRIYRVETQFLDGKSDEKSSGNMEGNAWPIGAILRRDYPEVESVLYSRGASFLTVNHEEKRFQQKIQFMTPEFFEIFSFPLLKGNPGSSLSKPYSIVITEDMEKKYFKGEDALNKTLTLADTLTFTVTGVLKNFPTNSHIQLEMLISFSTYEKLEPQFNYNDGWGNINMRNYVLLKEGTDAQAFQAKAKNIYMQNVAEQMKNWGVSAYVQFQPLNTLYLTSRTTNGVGPTGSITRVYLIAGIGIFVILLACINFINLTTARSVYRAKEVGLKKVVGSTRQSLIRQFLGESFLLTVIAFALAVALTGVVLPFFNQLLNKTYSFSSLLNFNVALSLVLLVVIVAIVSGYYPSAVMSRMKISEVIKGKLHTSSGATNMRRALVVFQFVISVGLVLGTLLVIDQLSFMQKQELGFKKDEIFVINAARVNSPNPNSFETFKNELKKLGAVEEVSFTNSLPGNPGWSTQVSYPEGKSGDDAVTVEYMAVDDNYVQTLGLQLVAGQSFNRDHETQLQGGLVLNETAVKNYGWKSAEEAIGKKIVSPSGYPAGEVIGVVKDYHQFGLQQNIGPMVMDYNPEAGYMYAIRYKAAHTQSLISLVEKEWKKTFPGFDFNYFFLDQDFEKQYQNEQRLATVFGFFAIVTIVIAAIGLLGLVSFMVVSRTKEIGVRKVLGANVLNIATLLSKEFVLLVITANLIAFPLIWYFANEWLQNFASRVSIDPLIFVLTFFITVSVTLITITFQTVKAATVDPVKSLRYE
jgi:putative ABC transport system permease protein